MNDVPVTVSVLIPTYNYAAFLPQAIDSALAQTVAPLEVVVADDGSTDATPEIAAGYGDRILYVRLEHAGIVALRNAMLPRLRGDWILNLDADDWVEPTLIAKAIELLRQERSRSDLAFVYVDRVDFGAYDRYIPSPEFDPDLLRKKNVFPFDAFIRRDVALRFGFDPAFEDGWEDYDFLLALVKNGYVGKRLPGPPVHCCVHLGSRTASTFQADRMQRLMRRIVMKHSDFFTPEEAEAAVDYFAPEAVLRHRVCELLRARRFVAAIVLLIRILATRPQALFSITVLNRFGQMLFSRSSAGTEPPKP